MTMNRSNRPPPLYALDLSHLSDEHMQHIYRFRGLGKFDRAKYEAIQRYCAARLKAWERAKAKESGEN